jgi:hypothetical protein
VWVRPSDYKVVGKCLATARQHGRSKAVHRDREAETRLEITYVKKRLESWSAQK